MFPYKKRSSFIQHIYSCHFSLTNQARKEQRQQRRTKRAAGPTQDSASEFLTPAKQRRAEVISTPASGGRWIAEHPLTDEDLFEV